MSADKYTNVSRLNGRPESTWHLTLIRAKTDLQSIIAVALPTGCHNCSTKAALHTESVYLMLWIFYRDRKIY